MLPEPKSTQSGPSEVEEDSSEDTADHSLKSDSTVDKSEQPVPSEESFELHSGEGNSSDGDDLSSDKQIPSSSNSPDLSTEGVAGISKSAETAIEPGELD